MKKNDGVNGSTENNREEEESVEEQSEELYIPATVVDGIWHFGYFKVDFTENEKKVLDQVIDNCEDGNLEKAARIFQTDDWMNLKNNYPETSDPHFLYRDYKIYIYTTKVLHKPLKYKVEYINKENINTYIYEGNENKNLECIMNRKNRCPYCGKKITYGQRFSSRRKAEFVCPRCGKESRVVINKKVILVFIISPSI